MLRLIDSSEEKFLRDTARDFFAQKMPVSQLRKMRDADDLLAYSPETLARNGHAGVGRDTGA